MKTTLTTISLIIIISGFTTVVDAPSSFVPLHKLNSSSIEVFPCLSPNGKHLFFAKSDGGAKWSRYVHASRDGVPEYDGDIVSSRYINNEYSKPVRLGNPAVNSSYGEGEVSIAADGAKVWFRTNRQWKQRGGPFFVARLEGRNFRQAVGLGGNITKWHLRKDSLLEARLETELIKTFGNRKAAMLLDYRENNFEKFVRYCDKHSFNESIFRRVGSGITVSPNEDFLIFADIDFEAEILNSQLFISHKENGKWCFPTMMDSNVNSADSDERFPSVLGDGRTILFSSNRVGGFGGHDIYRSEMQNGQPTIAVNVGRKINSPENEQGITVSCRNDQPKAILVRNYDLWGVPVIEEIEPYETVLVDGSIFNDHGLSVAKIVTLTDKAGNIIYKTESNSESGAFSMVAPYKEGYTLSIRNINGRIIKKDIAVQNKNSNHFEMEFEVPFEMPKGKTINTATIHFLVKSDTLDQKARAILDDVISSMPTGSNSYILLFQGHCNSFYNDPRGSYNRGLNRGKAAYVYCKYQHNISMAQMAFISHGSSKPAKSNKTLAGRRANQRVEVSVIQLNPIKVNHD